MPDKIIVDTSVLIALDKLNLLSHLTQIVLFSNPDIYVGVHINPCYSGFSPKQIINVAKANILLVYFLHDVNLPAVGRSRGYTHYLVKLLLF